LEGSPHVSVSITDFWKLLAESRLLTLDKVRELARQFERLPPDKRKEGAVAAANWLVQQHALTRYQARVLLAGRSGPFFYGDYKVDERVEIGGLTGWFRGHHVPTGHPVMLRFASGALLTDPGQWALAQHAVAGVSQIASPYLLRYFEAVDLRTHRFVVSEDVQGETLAERLQRGPLPASEACRIARLVALGLAQLHAAGRVHGDVRPQQVLLEPLAGHPDHVRLLFDVLSFPGPVDWRGDPKELAPRADYLAPELLTAGRPPDAASDLYALGCLLYAMLSGEPPFAGGSVQEKMARHSAEGIRPLDASKVPPPLMQVLTYFLAKSPTVRLPSALVAAEQLALFVEPSALAAPVPGVPPTLPAFELAVRSRSSARAAGGPAVAAVAGAAAGSAMPAAVVPQVGVPFAASGGAPLAEAAPVPLAAPAAVPGGFPAAVATAGGWQAAAPVVPVASPAPAVELAIQTSEKPRPARSAQEILRRRQQQKRRQMLVGLAVAVLVAIGGAAGYYYLSQRQPGGPVASGTAGTSGANAHATGATKDSTGSTPGSGSSAVGQTETTSGSGTGGSATSSTALPDDGQALWASPTSGEPLVLAGVPPEAQVFLYVRPAELLAQDEGRRVLEALGPELGAARQVWEAASGFALAEVETLLITLHNNAGQFPRVHFVVTPKERLPREALLARWGQPTLDSDGGYYRRAGWAYFPLTGEGEQGVFAMGQPEDVKEVASAGGRPPPVFREIERLRRFTDAQRHFTLLFYPQFFFNDDGQPLFAGPRAKARAPLAWLLGEHLQAGCFSGHVGQRLYLELRMLPSLDQDAYQLAQALRDRLDQVPSALEDYLVRLDPPAYWKKLAFRFPAMVRELHNYLRIGVENEQAVVNSVLPPFAAHNLVLGGELLLHSGPAAAVAVVAAPTAGPTGPQTIEEALQLKTTFSFDAQSLEFAMRDLAEDVKGNLKGSPVQFAIKILGSDLEKEGITRNQTIRDFKQENQTVADILTALVRKANPITTVQDPSELDQKLIWVIGPDPDQPATKIVLITTRAAAAERNYVLPPPFVPKVAGKKKTK
jgi:hypothetical protein